MEINEQNYLELFKPAILNEQIFNLKEAYLLDDVCLYACADVEDLDQELKILQPFHVFVKDGEIWISKNVKCELSIQGFPLWTITIKFILQKYFLIWKQRMGNIYAFL